MAYCLINDLKGKEGGINFFDWYSVALQALVQSLSEEHNDVHYFLYDEE